MQRASWFSPGFTSTEPSGQTASTSPAAAPYCSISAAAPASWAMSTTWLGSPLRFRETLQPHHGGRLRPAYQHRAAGAGLDQRHAPQNQRAHHPLAQVGFGNDERAQLAGRHQQGIDVVLGMAVDQRGRARQLADFGQELARPLGDDGHHMAQAVALGDGDRALEHHKHAGAGLTGGEQPVASF
jgi:hypothetical protein